MDIIDTLNLVHLRNILKSNNFLHKMCTTMYSKQFHQQLFFNKLVMVGSMTRNAHHAYCHHLGRSSFIMHTCATNWRRCKKKICRRFFSPLQRRDMKMQPNVVTLLISKICQIFPSLIWLPVLIITRLTIQQIW